MDLLRSRAVPALIAALCVPAVAGAADCSALEGTYRFESVGPGESRPLSDLTRGPGANKLYRIDAKGSAPGGLNPTQTMRRPKTTLLASTAALIHSAGRTRFRFMDPAGATLVEMGIDDPVQWTCKASRLERSAERTAGLGNVIRTEKVDEVLERNQAGDLVYLETVTVVDPPGAKPVRREARFPRVP
ncbi:MAG TPA: hypothetical protein VF386_04165 [Usitatibacter sp.]